MNRKAFTLIELLVAGLLLSMMGIGFMKLTSVAFRAQNTVHGQIEFGNLKMSLQTIFENPKLCGQALRDATGSPLLLPTNGPVSFRLGGTVLAEVGSNLGYGVELTTMNLNTVDGPIPLGNGDNRYVGLLELAARKGTDHFGSATHSNIGNPFLLSIDTNSGGTIVRCGLMGSRGLACTTGDPITVTRDIWSPIFLINDGYEIPSSSTEVIAGLDGVYCDATRPRNCWSARYRLRRLSDQIKTGPSFRVPPQHLCPPDSVVVGSHPANAGGSVDKLCANLINSAGQKAILVSPTSQTIDITETGAVSMCPIGQVMIGSTSFNYASSGWSHVHLHCATPVWESCS